MRSHVFFPLWFGWTDPLSTCSICSVTYVLPGPQAVGQVLGVQNSDSALENRFICLKNATAEGNQWEENYISYIFLWLFFFFFCSVWGRIRSGRKRGTNSHKSAVFNGVYSLLLASHSALSTPGGSAVRANMSVCVIHWHTCCCCRYGRSSRILLLIPLEKTGQG